jgi:hypothetical protein
MRKQKRHKQKRHLSQQPAAPKQPEAPPPAAPEQPVTSPPKRSRSIGGKLLPFILAVATLVGVPGALLVLLPRIIVEGTGDFSKPASIAFVTTNTGSIPLRDPIIGMTVCELTYNSGPKPPPCDLSWVPPDKAKTRDWLDVDEKYTLRLEDVMVIANTPIVRASVIVIVGYYPWYLPVRLYKRFGFLSAKGSDGTLYWRPYSP